MADGQPTNANVLYFPHIEISDSSWLKSALCIWDAVYRIVPAGYHPKDSDEVRQAVDAGAVRDITLSMADLAQAREHYHDFLESVPMIPDAIDRPALGKAQIHREKLDERTKSELSDLLGTLTRDGDWLELPRGVADGYMLFLADVVARRRAIPKLTDSQTMFVTMQYFAMDGNMDETPLPTSEGDMSSALIFRYISPAGIHEKQMSQVLRFREANTDGRQAFRRAVDELATKLSRVEDGSYARELVVSFIRNLQESEQITLAWLREHFAQPEMILLCLGVPVAAKVFEVLSKSDSAAASLSAVSLSFIYALADVMKSRRKDWIPAEATYLAKLRQNFVGNSPIPKGMPDFGYMMNEFMND
jgi:hypothetical protein